MFGTAAFAQVPYASAPGAEFAADVSETAISTATGATIVSVQAQVSEHTAAVLASVTAAASFLASLSENIQAADDMFCRFLWEDIDDSQNPGWTDILQPTTIKDQPVFGGSNFGVTSFAGQTAARYSPAGTLWVEIDNSQTTTWTIIEAY